MNMKRATRSDAAVAALLVWIGVCGLGGSSAEAALLNLTQRPPDITSFFLDVHYSASAGEFVATGDAAAFNIAGEAEAYCGITAGQFSILLELTPTGSPISGTLTISGWIPGLVTAPPAPPLQPSTASAGIRVSATPKRRAATAKFVRRVAGRRTPSPKTAYLSGARKAKATDRKRGNASRLRKPARKNNSRVGRQVRKSKSAAGRPAPRPGTNRHGSIASRKRTAPKSNLNKRGARRKRAKPPPTATIPPIGLPSPPSVILLTGTISQFGFSPQGGEIFEFLFDVTGGALSQYYSGQAMVILNAGNTGFDGTFVRDFANSGFDGVSNTFPNAPEPSTGTLMLSLIGSGLAAGAFRRRRRR